MAKNGDQKLAVDTESCEQFRGYDAPLRITRPTPGTPDFPCSRRGSVRCRLQMMGRIAGTG
jgi:hypothetical protein